MSLYVFDVYPDRATVSADTRMSFQAPDGTMYRLHDHEPKLYVVDDMIITVGGIAWIGRHIVKRFQENEVHTAARLHKVVLETVSRLDELADELGALDRRYRNNPFALEICALRYEPSCRHNVFYHIVTNRQYRLERFDVDGIIHPSARCYGGIDTGYVQAYFKAHPQEVKQDYIRALIHAYESAASERIGGTLVVAKQKKQDISTSEYPLKDARKIRDYSELIGHNIAGQNLVIECPDVNGGIMQYKVDRSGVFQYNGRQYFQSDKGGKLGQDAHWGIFGGTKDLFDVTDTGYVKPSFAGENGEILLDEDGFPRDVNFLLGIDGTSYFRGVVHATGGKFVGDVFANNYYFNDGESIKALLDQATKKFDLSGLDYIDLGGIQLDGKTGDIMLSGSINWGNNIPNKQRFAASTSGPWHDTMQSGDIYCCDWNYATGTWGEPYKKVGTDGAPGHDGSDGSDADVTRRNIEKALAYSRSLGSSYMAIDSVGSPIIYGGKIYGSEIYAGGSMTSGGIAGTGAMIGLTSKGFELSNEDGDGYISMTTTTEPGLGVCGLISSQSDTLLINGKQIAIGDGFGSKNMSGIEMHNGENICRGSWDFTDAQVSGLHLTFS